MSLFRETVMRQSGFVQKYSAFMVVMLGFMLVTTVLLQGPYQPSAAAAAPVSLSVPVPAQKAPRKSAYVADPKKLLKRNIRQKLRQLSSEVRLKTKVRLGVVVDVGRSTGPIPRPIKRALRQWHLRPGGNKPVLIIWLNPKTKQVRVYQGPQNPVQISSKTVRLINRHVIQPELNKGHLGRAVYNGCVAYGRWFARYYKVQIEAEPPDGVPLNKNYIDQQMGHTGLDYLIVLVGFAALALILLGVDRVRARVSRSQRVGL
ncbi:MAG: hypothetical protein KC474_09745 [Cyanobacteria bacterium HKST-UBA04]|nr:hypothetical protein [Cyanobacteria bacterium HKST-UBA04]